MKRRTTLLIIFLILCICYYFLPTPQKGPMISIRLEPGISAFHVAKLLEEKGLISSPKRFLFWVKILGVEKKMQTGTYNIRARTSYRKIVDMLAKGETVQIKITIPEGWRAEQIASRLSENGLCSEERFLKIVKERNLEGYLFPETYLFSPPVNIEDVIDTMLKEFRKNFTDEIAMRAKKYNFTEKDVVILASMIEKEAKTDEERFIVSAIFHNRLRKRMRLESCATVRYAVNNWGKKLSYDDTRVKHPYNTYRKWGLPPGPICNPGRKSLEASVKPAKTNAIFFVSDGKGTHVFSEYYKEHLKVQE